MMKEFVAFMKTHHGYPLTFDDGKFTDSATQLYWECWQAAQQSVQRTGGESGQQNLFTVGNPPPAKVTAKSPRR